MNGCIYRTKDGECDLYAEGGKYTAFCEMENCEGRKITNADRIRSMTDEELAKWLSETDPECDPPEWLLRWLKEEVSEWLKAEVSE